MKRIVAIPKFNIGFRKALVVFITYFPFASALLLQLLHLPSFLKYTVDFSWGLSLLFLIGSRRNRWRRQERTLLVITVVFIAYTAVVYLFRWQSPLFYLWGARNNFRFFVYFFALIVCTTNMDKQLIVLDGLYYFNAAVMLVQFFVFHLSQDYLGGIFGVVQGCNAYTNIFFCCIISRSVVLCFLKKEKVPQTLLKCVIAIGLAALAELKAFFVEFIIILVLAVFLTGLTRKKISFLIIALMSVVVGAYILGLLFPVFKGFLSFEKLVGIVADKRGYTGSGDLNRFTAIQTLWKEYMDSTDQRLFGFGLGNCDYSDAFETLTTPFYLHNKDLHYAWLSSAMMFLETGLVGLIMYVLFFVKVAYDAWMNKRTGRGVKEYDIISIIIVVIILFCIIYNSSMRTEAAYIAYLFLSCSYIGVRNRKKLILKQGEIDAVR